MASGNGSVTDSGVLYIRVPPELHYLCKQIASKKRLTLTQAVRVLIETHPDVAKMALELYAGSVNEPSEGNAHS